MIERLAGPVKEQLDCLLRNHHHDHYRSRLYGLAAAITSGLGEATPTDASACLIDGHSGALLWLGNNWLLSLSAASGEMRLALVHPLHALGLHVVGRDGSSVRATLRRGDVEVVQLPIEQLDDLCHLARRVAGWAEQCPRPAA
jgi:hypothetical protein